MLARRRVMLGRLTGAAVGVNPCYPLQLPAQQLCCWGQAQDDGCRAAKFRMRAVRSGWPLRRYCLAVRVCSVPPGWPLAV